jgi:serine/threonine-protein phosphatase 4 regulatory subunit 1
LGPSSWKNLIPVYVRMTEDRRLRVRRTLSFSLHEVANLIDEASELIPILEKLLDDVIEVKEGVLENLPEFISKL